MNKKRLAVCLIALALVACSKTEADKALPTLAQAQSPAQLKAAVTAKQLLAAPKGDARKPLLGYEELSSGKQLYFAQIALSSMPVDYEKVSEAISPAFRNERDAFKRKDMATALKPGIDQEIVKARQAGYYFMEISDYPVLETFNFEKKTFGVRAFQNSGSTRYFNDLSSTSLAFSNGLDFAALAVADEARARDIESRISKFQALRLRVYMFINSAVLGEERVRAQVMKVQLLDSKGVVLAEQ